MTTHGKKVRQLATDMANCLGISFTDALYKIGLVENEYGELKSIRLGDIEAAKRLGIRINKP
jgi:hypothetical protein